MKFEKEVTLQGAFIPHSALKLSGFSEGQEVELHTLGGAVVLIHKQMTAKELVDTIASLRSLSANLMDYLIQLCGACENCGDNGCPYKENCYMELSDTLCLEAGIPQGAKLCAVANPEAKTVTISLAEYAHDLRDVPSDVLATLQKARVCLGELEERLMTEDTVYGGDK